MKLSKRVETMKPSYIREILEVARSRDVISLAGGLPADDSFPLHLMQESLSELTNSPHLFQYGVTQGYAPLRDFLYSAWKLPQDHDVIICNGSQQGLDLIARACIDRGDSVAMEAPSYLGALQVFALAESQIKLVRQERDGPDIDELEALFKRGQVRLFYAVPDFHNPTGIVWSLEKRRAVARLCETYSVGLVEDAPYRELRFTGETLPLVSSFCPQQSLVLRSFSKITTPSLRLGAVYGPKRLMASITTVKQAADLHTNIPLQAVMLKLFEHAEFPAHVANIKNVYRERYRVLSTALRDELGDLAQFEQVQGGMFIWLQLLQGDPAYIAAESLRRGVAVVPGSEFYPAGYSAGPALRLNFTHPKPSELNKAAGILAQVLKASGNRKVQK